MYYRIDVTTDHQFDLVDEFEEDALVQEYHAKILASPPDGDEVSLAGMAEFYIVKVGLAVNLGIDLLEVVDSITQAVYEYGSAVIDEDTHDIREDIEERFGCIGGDLMMLHLMEILPSHRGRNLGLVAADKLIDQYASGLVICRPQPLQRNGREGDVLLDRKEMKYGAFSRQPATGERKLQRYWKRIGFEPISDTGIFALGTATNRPRVGLRRAKRTSRRAQPQSSDRGRR